MRQIKPPGNIPQELSSVFRHVYDEIQKLAQSINSEAGTEASDRTGGKSGDIRLVNDKTGAGYSIEGRFDEGWVRFNLGAGQLQRQGQRPPLQVTGAGDNGLNTIQSLFPPITSLSGSVQPGIVSVLPIVPIGSDGVLKEDDIITVVSLTGYVATFTISSNVGSSDTTISVNPTTVLSQLQKGNGIYLTQKSLTTWVSELEYSISIGAQLGELDVLAKVDAGSGYLTKGTTYTPSGGITVVNSSNTLTITRSSGSFTSDGVIVDAEIEIDDITCTVTSAGTTTIVATGTVSSGSYASYILGRTSIPVTPLPISIRGDLGWKVIVQDLENGKQYVCQTTALANTGSTSISIKPKILGVKDQSPITLDQLSLVSYINISGDAIDLRSLFLAGAIYLGDLSTTYSGTVTSLSLKSPFLRVPIKANDILFIVDNTNPELVSTHTVTSNTDALSSTIPINSSTVSKPIDSKVYLTANSSSALLRITGDSISSVVQRYNANNSICQLSSAVNGTVTSLPISGLTVNLYNGDRFFVYNATTLAPTEIQLTSDVTSGAVSLPVQSVTLNVPSGSGVHLQSSYARSQIKQTADNVVTSIEKFSVAGSLGVISSAYSGISSPFSLALSAPGLPYAMFNGDRIYVVDKVTGDSTILQLTADASLGATSISVTKVGGGTFTASNGSGVHVDTALVRSTLTQTATSITSIIETSSTGNSIATLTSAANGTVTTLQVTSLPISLSIGQKLYVVNNSNGIAYPVIVNAAALAGATSLSIQSTTVIAPIGSGLNLNTGDYGSKLSQTLDGFALTATNLYGNIYLGSLATSYSGSTSSLDLSQLLYPIKNGNVLYIVNTANPKEYISVTATEDKAATGSPTNVGISTISVIANSGSPVYLGATGSSSSLKILNDQISLAVTQDTFRDYIDGQRLGEVASVVGSTVNLNPGLSYEVFDNDTVRFSHNPDLGQTITSHPSVITRVTRTATPKVGYPAGTTAITVASATGISAGMIMTMEVAGAYSTGSSINVYLDNITIDTNLLKSNNYVSGTSGWAIKDDGTAEFGSVILRGSLTTTASSGNNVKILDTDGEVFVYAQNTNTNSGGIHVLSNPVGSSRFGLTLHENSYNTKQTTRKFTIYHNNDNVNGGSLVMQYASGTPQVKLWGVADTGRAAVTAGTFEAVNNSRFYGNFYKANDKAVEFNVTQADASSVFKITSNAGSFPTSAGAIAGYIYVDINGNIYKMPFYN
jgi:hypothetical protein